MKERKKLSIFKNARLILVASFLLFIAFGVAYGYIYFTIQNISYKTQGLAEEVSMLSAQEATVGVLKSSLASTKEKQTTIHSFFVDSTNIVPFLETIEGYGTNANVSVKFVNVAINPSPASLNVSLTAVGSFPALYHFLALLEAAPYELGINTATIQSVPSTQVATKKGPPPPDDWQGNISLSIYSVNE